MSTKMNLSGINYSNQLILVPASNAANGAQNKTAIRLNMSSRIDYKDSYYRYDDHLRYELFSRSLKVCG